MNHDGAATRRQIASAVVEQIQKESVWGARICRSALLLWTVAVVVPQASEAQSAQTSTDRLHSEIRRIALSSKGTVGVAAIHLSSGRHIELNGEQPFGMASTLKVPLGIYALRLGEEGKIALDTALPVRRDQLIEPGVLYDHFRFPGLALSTLNAIELSITISDNGATDIIYSRVGGPRAVNTWLQSIGLEGINMGTQTVAETFEKPQVVPGARTATPNAKVELLARLHRGQLLGKQGTATMLDVMSRTLGERMSLQLPYGTKVLHKTGTLFGDQTLSVNDVGIIELPDGTAVAIAVFIKDSPTSVAHSTRDKVIGGISRAVYDYFLLSN